MLPTNNNERKRKFTRFSLYYGLSVAAVCVIVFAFADVMNSEQATSAALPDNSASQMVFSADSLLHRQLSALENLDNRYGSALAIIKTREGMRTADSLRRVLPMAEQDFQFTLDSVSRMSRVGSNPALRQTVDFFAAALALRTKRLASPRSSTAALPPSLMPPPATAMMTADELIKNNPELKGEMLKKDIRIADLESTISLLKKKSPEKMPAEQPAGTAAGRQLQQDYETLQKNYKTLAETNNRLRNASTQPASTPSPTGSEPAETDAVKTARARSAKMEQQLREMNADLSFSTVDCNLSRADVNQIIYNGKQRKVLLQQALDILTALKKSGDEEVQKRAMQKISQLDRIAMTVRD